jgi:hypothetical protein
MTSASDGLRFEVAFATNPDDATPAWVDLTSRLDLEAGVTVRRGREDEYDIAQTGTAGVTLDNTDGALTPDDSSSPYYPYVLPQRRCRLTHRSMSTRGAYNMLSAENASFEGGTVGSWVASGGAAVANDTTHADVGTKALRITWPTAAATASYGGITVSGLTIGRTYTARARVWSATGVPDIQLRVASVGAGTATSTKNAFATITITFTATAVSHLLYVSCTTSSTAGQQTWVDAVMLDEGSTLGTFTTSQASTVILSRFDGYVDEWPIEWPGGTQNYSQSSITAADMFSRIGARQKLRSVVEETFALDVPVVHFPLAEKADSTQVSSVYSDVPVVLSVQQIGSGGTLVFGDATGAPTDGGTALTLAAASLANGKMLGGGVPTVGVSGYTGGLTLEANAATTSVLDNTAATLSDAFGTRLSIGFNAAPGEPYAVWKDGLRTLATVVGGTALNDGLTHHLAAVLSGDGSAVTLSLYVDGALEGSSAPLAPAAVTPFTQLTIGGVPGTQAFTGTLSHVAAYSTPLSAGSIADHREALTTGFAGERSDERLSRVASWIGLPAARCNFDVGNSTSVGHIDTTGMSPLDYMRKIEATEAGLLFPGADGRLTFHNRARSYASTAPAVTVPSRMLGAGARLTKNLQLVRNIITGSRDGGATVRMVDQTSVDTNGPLTEDLDIVTTSDDDVRDAVAWRLNTRSEPRTRFSGLDLDALTDATYSPSIRSAVDIGARVSVTGMPSQAPTSTLNQAVQGYAETITPDVWTITVNATPYEHMVALILDDTTYGVLDSYPLAY